MKNNTATAKEINKEIYEMVTELLRQAGLAHTTSGRGQLRAVREVPGYGVSLLRDVFTYPVKL